VARVYCTNNAWEEVPIPSGFTIRDDTNHVRIVPIGGEPFFVLHWGDNYTITFHGLVVFKLVTHRQWTVDDT
jgi:hypothetical protein